MVKGLVFAAGVALVASTFQAQAMPAGPIGFGEDSLVTTVAEGCGRGWERNRFGECRPFRGRGYGGPAVVVRPPVVVAPRGVAPRRCVTRVTPYGVREVCR
ncbi:MAG: GCG_CRPN prefix-to-repeats domain-containing protein [Microvirga sp.]